MRMAEMLGIADAKPLVENGLGAIGTLPREMMSTEFIAHVRDVFGAPYVRHTVWEKPICCVAMCGGAGAEFIDEAIRQGADAYVTADVKYHEFQAAEGRIALLDIDHWYSEKHSRDILMGLLSDHVTCYVSQADRSPVMVEM